MDLDIGKDKTKVSLDYDYEVYRKIKNVNNSQYQVDHTWLVDNKYMLQLLEDLAKMNMDVESAMRNVKNSIKQHEHFYNEEKNEAVKTIELSVVKENPKSIVLKFDYDQNVIGLIKKLEQRKYNVEDKSWAIHRKDLKWVYDKLSELQYVDSSSLNKYVNHDEEIINITKEDFPKMNRVPYPFQLDVANQMANQKKIINALEAGLGKTMITVMTCETIKKKTIVICPATVKENWKKEIHIVNPDAKVSVLYANEDYKTGDYVILNYDIIKTFINDIKKDNFGISVFDEAHKIRGIKNNGKTSSQRANYSLQIARQTDYAYPLTATPFINQTKDIFNLLKVIEHPLSFNWYPFANTYCKPERSDFGVKYDGSSNQEQLYDRLYPHAMIRLRTEDHIELPEKTRSFIPLKINLTKYHKEVDKYMTERNSIEDNGQHLVYMNIMRMKLAEEKAKESVKLIKDLLEQNESVVVFTNYTSVAQYVSNKFKDDSVMVTGDIDSKQRQKNVELFQSGKKKVFIGNIDAAGEGITLTAASQMIVIDMHYSPVVMVNQMEKRIHRISQTRPSKVMYLYAVGATMDEMLVEMAESKFNDASTIIDGTKEVFAEELIKKGLNM